MCAAPDEGCFTNVSRALQNDLAKYAKPEIKFMVRTSSCNFVRVPKALGTRTKFQLEIRIRTTISAIHKFRENIWEGSRNASETPTWWPKRPHAATQRLYRATYCDNVQPLYCRLRSHKPTTQVMGIIVPSASEITQTNMDNGVRYLTSAEKVWTEILVFNGSLGRRRCRLRCKSALQHQWLRRIR